MRPMYTVPSGADGDDAPNEYDRRGIEGPQRARAIAVVADRVDADRPHIGRTVTTSAANTIASTFCRPPARSVGPSAWNVQRTVPAHPCAHCGWTVERVQDPTLVGNVERFVPGVGGSVECRPGPTPATR